MAREAIDTPTTADFEQYQLPETAPDVSPITDSPNGVVLSNGEFASPNYVPGVSGWKLDSQGNFEAVNGTFSGTLQSIALNIPDATTANSFHTDVNGNTWWGANVATGYTGANAYILNTGAAVFKNIQVGGTTIQYVITNSGIFSYGDNQDGSATCDGSTAVTGMSRSGSTYTMTRDCFFSSLTINSGITVVQNNWRLLGNGTLTLNGTLDNSGTSGSKGGTGTYGFNPGAAGSAGATPGPGYFPNTPAPGAGGSGTGGAGLGVVGVNGGNVTNSIGTIASGVGGSGGWSHGGPGAVGGSVGTWTTAFMLLKVGVQLALLCDFKLDGTSIKYGNSSGAGGGGGGGGGNEQSSGGGGGGGGGNGGISAIYFRSIVIGSTGIIKANGGNGGDGGDVSSGTSPASHSVGGGGGAGNGGVVILVYNSLSNLGSVTATAGTGGAIGTVSGPGNTTGASAGGNGSAGTVYQFQLSL